MVTSGPKDCNFGSFGPRKVFVRISEEAVLHFSLQSTLEQEATTTPTQLISFMNRILTQSNEILKQKKFKIFCGKGQLSRNIKTILIMNILHQNLKSTSVNSTI